MNTKPTRYGKQPINGRQIKAIHTIISKLGMSDGDYRLLLSEMFGVTSSKKLSWREAEDLVEELNRKAGNPVNSERKTVNGKNDSPITANRSRYSDLDGRPGMASGAQCRMIEAMWAEVSRVTDEKEREYALWAFLRRIVHVDHFRFMKSWQVSAVVKAIAEMKKAKGVADGR